MKTTYGALTDPGRAHQVDQHNEDALWVSKTIAPASLAAYGALYIVADGIGGHANGEVASQLAVETISAAYYQNPDPDRRQALYQAILAANTAIYQRTPGIDGSAANHMGSTMVAVVIKAGQLIVANLGDSRAYVVRGKQAHVISEDHTLVAEMLRRQLLSAEEAATHPDRSTLTRSLGQETTCQPFISNWLALQPTDRVVLCTDGLWDVIGDAQLARLASQGALQTAAQALINAANARGGPDNVTAIVIGDTAYAGAGLLASLMALPPLWLAGGAGLILLALLLGVAALSGPTKPFPTAALTSRQTAVMSTTVITSSTPTLLPTVPVSPTETVTPAPAPTESKCGEYLQYGYPCIQLRSSSGQKAPLFYDFKSPTSSGRCEIQLGAEVAVLKDQASEVADWRKVKIFKKYLLEPHTDQPCTIDPSSGAPYLECDPLTCNGYTEAWRVLETPSP